MDSNPPTAADYANANAYDALANMRNLNRAFTKLLMVLSAKGIITVEQAKDIQNTE